MTLQALSSSLLELYDVAEHTGPNTFTEEVFRIVNKLICFDGAMLGRGSTEFAHKTDLMIDQFKLPLMHNEDANARTDCQRFMGMDPRPDSTGKLPPGLLTAVFAKGLSKPLATDYKRLYHGHGEQEMAESYLHRKLRKLLLYCDAPSKADNARWVILSRNAGDDFTESDAFMLEAIWHHVTRTIEINLSRALDRIDPHHAKQALALVGSRATIEIANPAMIELLKSEWPSFSARSFPLPVISALLSNGTYRGRQIEISASQKFGYLACTARRIPLIDTLAPTELNVADRFAKGMTHSQIAAILHVSPHTVRNQLAQVYQKLGVHSKIELMRAMSSQ